MGGADSRLPEQTPWSLILAARTENQTRRQLAVENLTYAYWKPVYCYLRRKRYTNEEAKDLTQEFFRRFILEDRLLQAADRELGSFRQLLSTALKRFVSNHERDRRRRKRVPEGGLVSLSSIELGIVDAPKSEATPDDAFHYSWITSLLDQILKETEEQCCNAGLTKHWQVFRSKVLAPIRENAEDLPLKEICQKYGIESETKACNMMVTVKRCFKRTLKRHLRDLTRSDSQAEEEFRDIFAFLSKNSARL